MTIFFGIIIYRPGWWCKNHLEKYESQWKGLSIEYYVKIKNVPNHQPVNIIERTSWKHVSIC
jgi:hypothetical protein